MKKSYLLILIIPLFTTCNEPQIQSGIMLEDVDHVKEIILKEYAKYHSQYFNDTQNCLFKNYVNNDILQYDLYFTDIYRGVLIKHFYCYYTNFHFSVLHVNGKYFYHGAADYHYLSNVIPNEEFHRVGSHYINKSDSVKLRVLPVEDQTLLQEVVNQLNPKDMNEMLNLYVGLHRSCHKRFEFEGFTQTSYLKLINGDWELEETFEQIKGASVPDWEMENVKVYGFEEIRDRIGFSIKHKSIERTYYADEEGILYYKFKFGYGVIDIDRYFVRNYVKLRKLNSDLIRPEKYNCFD